MTHQTEHVAVPVVPGEPEAAHPSAPAAGPVPPRLAEVLEYGARLNDVDRRAWVLACAQLTGLGPETPRPDDEFIARVLDDLRRSELFPWGPLAYVEPEVSRAAPDDLSVVAFTHRDAGGADDLTMFVGFSSDGVVATSFTRSGFIGGEANHPGDVLLSDVEAACVDLYALAGATANQYGYTGPMDVAVSVVYRPEGPGRLRLRHIDPESGRVRPDGVAVDAFEPVHARVDMSRPLRDRYATLREMASTISTRFGAPETEFFIPVEEIDFSDYAALEDAAAHASGGRGTASA